MRNSDRRANRLAHRLRECGVGLDAVVPVFWSASPDLLISLLAVMKAGGAYLPLVRVADPKAGGDDRASHAAVLIRLQPFSAACQHQLPCSVPGSGGGGSWRVKRRRIRRR